jgi:hypothetical protein
MTKIKLTETFHVVQLENCTVYYLVHTNVLKAYENTLGDMPRDELGFLIGNETLGDSWGYAAESYGLQMYVEADNLDDYCVCIASVVPSEAAIRLTRTFCELVLSANEQEQEPDVIPTTRVW